MNQLINFPELLSMAIIYSIATATICYILLRLILCLLRGYPSLLKYQLSNACLLLAFLAFLWPFKDLHFSKSTSANIDQPYKTTYVIDNKVNGKPAQDLHNTSATSLNTDVNSSTQDARPEHIQQESLLNLLMLKVNEWSNIILTLYFAGLLFFSFRLLASYMYSRSLKRKGISPANEQWLTSLQYVMDKLQINPKLKIFFSSKTLTPCIIGHSKAVILIPIALSTQLSIEQAEAILLHELAHLKHYDYYINLAIQAISCLLFFNPFVWLIVKKCKQYREQACDEITAKEERSIELAESLAFIAANASKMSALTLMLKETHHNLLFRIQNLLGRNQRDGRSYSSLAVMLVPLILSVCMVLYSTNIFSQKKDDLKTRLEKVSQQMFNEGNPRYIVVDAILDSLFPLPEAKIFRLADTSFPRYDVINFDLFVDYLDTDKIFVNNQQLHGPLMHKYSSKLSQFLSKQDETYLPTHISYVSRDTPKLKEIFDSNSDFRKISNGAYPANVIFTKHRKKVINTFLADKLLNPNDKSIAISFEKNDLEVNGKTFPATLRDKYRKLFETEIGTDFNDISFFSTIVWNLPCPARAFIDNTSRKYITKQISLTNDIQTKLRAVSNEMFKQGNEKYAVVDAIIDTLLPLYEASFLKKNDTPKSSFENARSDAYEVGFSKDLVMINYKALSGEKNNRYTRKMKMFLLNLNEPHDTINIRNFYGSDIFTLSALLNPNSPARKLDKFSKWEAGIYTQFRKQIIQNLVADGIILPSDDTVNIQCYSVDTTAYIKINDIPLSGSIRSKYVELMNSGMGNVLHHNHLQAHQTWKMPNSAAKYIMDMPPLNEKNIEAAFDDPIKDIRDQMVAVSKKMFDEGNEKYIIVDAIIDSLLPLRQVNSSASQTASSSYKVADKVINIHYMGHYPIFINGKPIIQGVWNAYICKMMAFQRRLNEPEGPFSVSYKNNNGVSLAEILDQNSSFRKLNIADRREAGFYTVPRKKMVKHLLEDKLISPADDKLSIAYNENSISINDKALSGKLRTKYLKLLEKEYGADLHHSYSGVWNMKGSAKEYISDLEPTEKQDKKTGLNSSPENIKSQLQAISKQMFDEGNEKYVIVDAIMDSLIGMEKHYDIFFMSENYVSANGYSLKKDARKRYYAKMQQFANNLEEKDFVIGGTQYNKPLTLDDILNPKSDFRKLNIRDRNMAGIRTVPKKKMIRHFLEDKLISPTDEKLIFTFGNDDIIINDKKLKGKMEAKYIHLLETEYGFDFKHDGQSGVWNMKGGAKEYIQDLPVKNGAQKTGYVPSSKTKEDNLRELLSSPAGKYKVIPVEFQEPPLNKLVALYNEKVKKLEADEKEYEFNVNPKEHLVQTEVELESLKKIILKKLN